MGEPLTIEAVLSPCNSCFFQEAVARDTEMGSARSSTAFLTRTVAALASNEDWYPPVLYLLGRDPLTLPPLLGLGVSPVTTTGRHGRPLPAASSRPEYDTRRGDARRRRRFHG